MAFNRKQPFPQWYLNGSPRIPHSTHHFLVWRRRRFVTWCAEVRIKGRISGLVPLQGSDWPNLTLTVPVMDSPGLYTTLLSLKVISNFCSFPMFAWIHSGTEDHLCARTLHTHSFHAASPPLRLTSLSSHEMNNKAPGVPVCHCKNILFGFNKLNITNVIHIKLLNVWVILTNVYKSINQSINQSNLIVVAHIHKSQFAY